MSAFPLVVTWWWGDPRYREAADRLARDCVDRGYDVRVRRPDLTAHFEDQFPDTRERIWVYRYIPKLLRQEIERTDRDLLYLHADLRITAPVPREAWGDADVGLESAWSLDPPRPRSVLAAPIFLRNNDRARRFLDLWCAVCRTVDDDRSEHHHLHWVWRLLRDNDRRIRFRIFDPPLAAIHPRAETPIYDDKW